MNLTWLLQTLPGPLVYVAIGLLIGVESIGIPVPGETALIAATLASRHPAAAFHPMGIALVASAGAIIGDSIGYWVGREKGNQLLGWMVRRFPHHVTPAHLGWARELMGSYGSGAVFGGRFVALLRMLAGPLAGTMGMHYPTFLAANAAGGILWAGGTVGVLWVLGEVAQTWLSRAGWIVLAGLLVAVLLGSRKINSTMQAKVRAYAEAHPEEMADWKATQAGE